jgi:hypothetical protein
MGGAKSATNGKPLAWLPSMGGSRVNVSIRREKM